MYGGFGFGFDLFSIAFFAVFAVIVIMFIVMAASGISRWQKNNRSPRLTVHAKLVAKRMQVRRRQDHGSFTDYYATFQVESGDRMEMAMPAEEYGLLVEGDIGNLTFQGTRFISFERV